MTAAAPIACFIYNRPGHLERALASLLANRGINDSPIFVFADGPRNQEDAPAVEAARRAAHDLLGSRAVYRLQADNAGLAAAISAGVSELVDHYGKVIVVEDDLQLAPGFLAYMNEALARFGDARDVYQVSGYMFATPGVAARNRAIFLPIVTTWGWGTWKRAWEAYDKQATGWQQLATNPQLRRQFNFGGVYDYSAMLERQMSGGADSWGIRWYWSVFRRQGLGCFPPQSLVCNSGMDGSGTHGRGFFRDFTVKALPTASGDFIFPTNPVVDEADLTESRQAVWRQNGGWLGYAVDRARELRRAVRKR